MHLVPTLPEDCVRARERISLELDSMLSEFERGALDSHLAQCPGCRVYRARLDRTTAVLRTAPALAPARKVELPHRPRTRLLDRATGLAAAASLALALSVAGAVSLQGPSASERLALRTLHERVLSLKQQQLASLDARGEDASPAPAPSGADPTTGAVFASLSSTSERRGDLAVT